MANRQAERHAEISRLATKLARTDGSEAAQLLRRFDTLISEASIDDRLGSPHEAVASLEIALYALGADRKHLRPEERLIQQAIRFLQSLICWGFSLQCALKPCASAFKAILSMWAGIA